MLRNTRRFLLLAVLPLGSAGCLLPPADAMVVVESSPPPPRYEVYSVAPGPDYTWVAGYWQWGGADYVWVSGRWELPPRGYHHYEPGRWQRHGQRYYWREGHWRH